MRLTSLITQESKWFVAQCPELGLFSQGKTIEDAQKNLKEAIELYLEDWPAKRAPIKTQSFLSTIEVAYA